MIKFATITCLTMAVLATNSNEMLAAQKKKNPAKPTPAKETPYQYCKRMIARDFGAAARLHHVVVSPSGKIHCWYYS